MTVALGWLGWVIAAAGVVGAAVVALIRWAGKRAVAKQGAIIIQDIHATEARWNAGEIARRKEEQARAAITQARIESIRRQTQEAIATEPATETEARAELAAVRAERETLADAFDPAHAQPCPTCGRYVRPGCPDDYHTVAP